MAIYDLGTASLSSNGEVTGVGTTWKAPLTLIRVGATIVFKTDPVKIYTISEIISDTQINVYNPNSEIVPAGTGYAILAHDGITVQGLAQDVAETLRYYQSRETEVADAVDAFNNFDYADFESKVTQVNSQSVSVNEMAGQVSSDLALSIAARSDAENSASEAGLYKNQSQDSANESRQYSEQAMSALQQIEGATISFDTVSSMIQSDPDVGKYCVTKGYWQSGDGGGSSYLISSGQPLGDYSDSGSVVISPSKFAKLIQKSEYNLKEFGMRAGSSYAADNDARLKAACLRSSFNFCKCVITDAFHISLPLVMNVPFNIIGLSSGGVNTWDPKLIKLGNATSGLSPMAYPGETDLVPMDIDAAVIISRSSVNQYTTRGVTLKGFKIESSSRSLVGIYAPHISDFDISVDISGFNTAIRGNVHFLGSLSGRFIGIGVNSTDPATAIGYWLAPFGSVPDTGNSVSVRCAFNNFYRGIQNQHFGNMKLDKCTFEQIKRVNEGSAAPVCINALSGSTITGEVSVETCTASIVRVSSDSNVDLFLSARFNVEQDSTTEGLLRVLSGGRLSLRSSSISGRLQDQLIIQDSGGYLSLGSFFNGVNLKYSIGNLYTYSDASLSVFQTNTHDKTSYSNGENVVFTIFPGSNPFATISSDGFITFNKPSAIKVTVLNRSVSTGGFEVGVNGSYTEVVTASPLITQMVAIFNVSAGDTLRVRSVGASTTSGSSSIRLIIEPLSK